MIFTGRLLASADGVSIWQEAKDGKLSLHFVGRGLVIDLTADELAALSQAAAAAIATATTAEDEKDRARRLQILQARVTDYLKRERAERET